jgi:activator of HSP90 ATPase
VKSSFSVSTTLKAAPEVLYNAWLDSSEHAAFTGSPASIDPETGGEFTAWDGYITGKTLEKEEHRRIVQSWRTTVFPRESDDSIIEVLFENMDDGTRLTINHSRIPEGQEDDYQNGWEEFYFKPMQAYYSRK